MNTYGFHTIHGRAPAFATGIKVANPELSVWVATGDGDGLSIGGNHLMHCLRRNVDIKILLFNNRIYGLTKGQYSPTSEFGKITKSTPGGSADQPVDPASFALGCNASFVARSVDTDAPHLTDVLRRAAQHVGTAFMEIYQNCPVFNDGAFDSFIEKTVQGGPAGARRARQAAALRREPGEGAPPEPEEALARSGEGSVRTGSRSTTSPCTTRPTPCSPRCWRA